MSENKALKSLSLYCVEGSNQIKWAFVLVSLVLLSACEGSVAANISHPQRQNIMVDGYTFGVVPNSDHWATWWISSEFVAAIPPLSTLKPLQIRAIEQASGCSVIQAEYPSGALQPAYLQAAVQC